MADTNFSIWNPTAANQENDSTYAADSQRAGGAVSGVFASALANKVFYQPSLWVRAFALSLVGKGFSPKDGTSPYVADASSNTAATALKTVLDNVLTTADRPAPLRDTTVHTHTGDTTLDTVVSLGPAASLASPQMVRVTCFFDITVQGAGATSVNLYAGSLLLISYSLTAVAGYMAELMFNLANSSVSIKLTKAPVIFSGTSDISINNSSSGFSSGALTFAVKVQNANNGDTQVFNYTLLEVL